MVLLLRGGAEDERSVGVSAQIGARDEPDPFGADHALAPASGVVARRPERTHLERADDAPQRVPLPRAKLVMDNQGLSLRQLLSH
jgi:hypothetical protein